MTKMIDVTIETPLVKNIKEDDWKKWLNDFKENHAAEYEQGPITENKLSFKVGYENVEDPQPDEIKKFVEEYARKLDSLREDKNLKVTAVDNDPNLRRRRK